MPNAQQSVIKASLFGDRFLTLSYGVTFSLYYDCSLFFSISARRHSHGKLSMSHTFPIESANTRSLPIATLDGASVPLAIDAIFASFSFRKFAFQSTRSCLPNLVTCATFA